MGGGMFDGWNSCPFISSLAFVIVFPNTAFCPKLAGLRLQHNLPISIFFRSSYVAVV